MKQYLAVAIAALAIHANSSADVMYRWISVTDAKPADVSLTLVFSDDAVASGSFSYRLAPTRTITDVPGLKYFGYGVDGITPMSYTPGTQTFAYGLGSLALDLRFDPAGYLTGSIAANDQNSDFAMTSTGDLFKLTAMHSDQDMVGTKFTCGTYTNTACTSTGILERMSSVEAALDAGAQVPEPGSLALTGLGLLGLARILKRRRG
jgi:hypothetical protein